ncbi:hypothetical protein H3T12_20925 [Streptomyces sp. GMR22]|nr:hypothetical protein [Streptomyces sp. GMR22]
MGDKFRPAPTPETQTYGDKARLGELWLPTCAHTGRAFFPPRARSPFNGGPVSWKRASGRATPASYVVVHRARPGFEGRRRTSSRSRRSRPARRASSSSPTASRAGHVLAHRTSRTRRAPAGSSWRCACRKYRPPWWDAVRAVYLRSTGGIARAGAFARPALTAAR